MAGSTPYDNLRAALDDVLVAIAKRGLAPSVGQALNPLCEAVDALEGFHLVREGEVPPWMEPSECGCDCDGGTPPPHFHKVAGA